MWTHLRLTDLKLANRSIVARQVHEPIVSVRSESAVETVRRLQLERLRLRFEIPHCEVVRRLRIDAEISPVPSDGFDLSGGEASCE